MAKKPSRSSAKTRKGKPGTAQLQPTARAEARQSVRALDPLKVAKGPDGMVDIDASAIPAKPLPSVRETVDALSRAIPDPVATSKRKKAARAGAHPPIPEAAGGPETAPSSAKLPTGEETAPKKGRPTAYTEEIAARICDDLADGMSLPRICEADGMPAPRTVRQWVLEDRDGFSARYARARECQAWGWADEINDIGDEANADTYTTEDGSVKVAGEVVQRSKLRCDNRKWLLSKLLPKQFGDKLDLNVDDKRPDSPEERLVRINQLLAMGVPKLPAGGEA